MESKIYVKNKYVIPGIDLPIYRHILAHCFTQKTNAMYMLVIVGIIVAAYFAAKGLNSANDISKY